MFRHFPLYRSPQSRLLGALALAGLGLLGPGCDGGGPASDDCAPPAALPDLALVDARALITADLDEGGARVQGLDHATKAGARISAAGVDAVADEHGRFQLDVGAAPGDTVPLTVRIGDDEETVDLLVKERERARACVVSPPAQTGTAPNDVVVTRCAERPVGLVPTSSDGALDVVPLDERPRPLEDTAYFPPPEGLVAASPWAVAALDDGRAVVTLQGTGEVALVAPCTGEVLHRTAPLDGQRPLRIDVAPPVTLREPLDVDGDGIADEVVTTMHPRAPQALVALGQRVFVTWTNYLEPALPPPDAQDMAMGPGLLTSFDVVGDELVFSGYALLPAKNPQGIALDDDGDLWVSASGPYGYDDEGRFVAAADGGLFRYPAATLQLEASYDAGRFSPASPAVVGDHLVVGSTLRARALVLPLAAERFEQGHVLELAPGEPDAVRSIFEAVRLPGGLVGLTSFEEARLRVVDPRTGALDPWPFDDAGSGPGLLVAEQGEALRGLLAADLDEDGRGAALLNLSVEVVPLDLRTVFGP